MPRDLENPVCYEICRHLSEIYFKVFHAMRVDGLENVPEHACIIASNHASFVDPPLAGCSVKTGMYYLARKSLFKPPIMDRLLPAINTVPVDLERPDLVGLKKVIALLKDGKRVVLFPEGTRSPDGNLLPGQPGIGFILSKVNVPVVPVRLIDSHQIWPKGGKLKLFRPLRVIYGKPLTFPAELVSKKENFTAVSQTIMDHIARLGQDP